MAATATTISGEIEPHILYDLGRFKQITTLGEAAIRRMRRQGLVVKYVGRRAYIKGSDFLTFVEATGTTVRGH